jgi:5,10-methylenetetrahydromethanopterin reductase
MAIRWGVWFEPTQPVSRLCDLAVLAEGLGAEACFVADEGTERDTWIALTAILGATESLTVAPAITNPFSRHPVTTAAAAATLHEMAPGRVWQGLGVGGSRVLEPLEVTEPRLYTALEKTLDVQRLLLTGGAAGPASLPWFTGDVPIAVAGRGPRVQALAADRADWVILSGKAVSDLPGEADRIRGAGDASIIWSAYIAWSETERPRVLRHFSYMALDAPPDIRAAAGLDDERAEAVRSAMLAGDLDAAAELLPDSLIEIYGVAGTPAECAATIAANRENFDLFMLPLNDESAAAEHIEMGARIFAQAGSLSGIAE